MSISVYIADDHAVVRDGLRVLLEANPLIKVVGDAADGRQAVREIQSLRPDIAILDISMPEINGITATQHIMQSCPEVRVIILSMLGTPEHVDHALRAGARGYLLKDSAGREVVEAVLAVAAGNSYVSQPIQNILISAYIQQRGDAEEKGPLASLSRREREILQMVVAGRSSSEIAALLFLSPKTVESYRSRMMHKLGVTDLAELIKFAMRAGLVS